MPILYIKAVPQELKEALQKEASKSAISMSALVRMVLAGYINNKTKGAKK